MSETNATLKAPGADAAQVAQDGFPVKRGDFLDYRLSASDAEAVNRRRTTGKSIAQRLKDKLWPEGAQAHVGLHVVEGDLFPLLVVSVAISAGSDEPTEYHVSGQAFLDGNDVFWVRGVREGIAPGQWASMNLTEPILIAPSA